MNALAFETPTAAPSDRLLDLRTKYAGLTGAALLESVLKSDDFGPIAAVSSFGAESVVLLHLISQVDASTPVLFLNTGKLFGETLRYRDRLQEVLGLTDLRAIGPHPDDLKQTDPDGILWSKDTNMCCHIRKTLPLERALKGFDGWITGRKRFQTNDRQAMDAIEEADGKLKFNPLAHWDSEQLQRYIAEHKLPAHPLVKDGYLSIGCMPCTDRVKPGEDARAGRWRGQEKDECGIHVSGLIDGDGI